MELDSEGKSPLASACRLMLPRRCGGDWLEERTVTVKTSRTINSTGRGYNGYNNLDLFAL